MCLANNCDLFAAYFDRCIKCSQNFCDVFRKSLSESLLSQLTFLFYQPQLRQFLKVYILRAILKTTHPIKADALYIQPRYEAPGDLWVEIGKKRSD